MLAAQLAEAQRLLADGQAQLALYAAQLEESQAAASSVAAAASADKAALAEAEEALLAEFSRREQLEAQLKSANASNAEGRARASLYGAQLEEAQQEASEALTRVSLLEAQLADARARFEQHEAEIEQAVSSATAAAVAEVKTAHGEIEEMKATLADEADRSHAEHEILRAEVDASREQLELAHVREQEDFEARKDL